MLELVLPILLIILFYKLIQILLKRVFKKGSFEEGTGEKVLKWIRITLRIVIIISIILLIGRLLGTEIIKYVQIFYNLLNAPIFESGSTKISIITLLLMIPVFYLASWLGQLTRAFLNQYFKHRVGLDASKRFSLFSLIRYTVMVLVLLVGLSVIGIDLSALTVMFGVLGIGLGFGLQNVVANFFAGIVIIFSRPIKEGDRILVNEYEGTVVNIRLLSTIVNTITYETIIVPNGKLIDNIVYNYSYDDRRIIIKNQVQVSYSTDLDKAIEVLRSVGVKNPYSIKIPEPDVRVESFGDSGIDLLLLTWISDVNHKHDAVSKNNLEIWRSFRENDIEIPFPQVDLHFRNKLQKDK